MTLKLLAGSMLAVTILAGCETIEPETLEQAGARAMNACSGAIRRSNEAGNYGYSLSDCQCVAGRITTPLWSSENSSYTGDPMPLADAQTIANALETAPTMAEALSTARANVSVPTSNSINTCFAK